MKYNIVRERSPSTRALVVLDDGFSLYHTATCPTYADAIAVCNALNNELKGES